MKKELALGDRAPDFILTDERGDRVSLADTYKSKNVLLIFYPGDMTPGCTMQLCAIRDEWPKFVKANTAVFGINHADAESHQAFKTKYNFPFPLLTDTKKKVSAAYGSTRALFGRTIIKRSVIGIDMNGTIVYLKRGMPKNNEILKLLARYAKH
jgi:thioredoxin-dependent peroxiredoxin